ncbi:MAG: hypothetical protein WBM78_10460, partial [Desulfobacterales bacterium]
SFLFLFVMGTTTAERRNGLRDEPQSAGGGNCICFLLQFTVPADREKRSPKGIGSPYRRADQRRHIIA